MELVTEQEFRENIQNVQEMVRPFKAEYLEPIGIDLTVGEHCINMTRGHAISLGVGEELEMRPGDFVIIFTNESLYVRDDYLGLLFPKVSLTLKGLSQSGGKVNPRFSGQLRVALKNEGHEVVRLKHKERICNVAFWRI